MRTAFLICPIGKEGSDQNLRSRAFLERIVRPTLFRLGFHTECFLDADYSNGGILPKMRHLIRTADICIADLTDNNPNVFYEYGLRRATERPVLAFVSDTQDLLFDVRDYHTPAYHLDNPQPAIVQIEEFVRQTAFGKALWIDGDRSTQTSKICDYIVSHQPKRINVLQVSLIALRGALFDAIRKCPGVTLCLLLLHPDEAPRYALGDGHRRDLRATEDFCELNASILKTERPGAEPTIGLWYYRHEPSIAACMIDNALVQVGWYLRSPAQGDRKKLVIRGHSQPSLIAEAEEAHAILPSIHAHFNAVWREAKEGPRKCFSGPKLSQLSTEWNKLKQEDG